MISWFFEPLCFLDGFVSSFLVEQPHSGCQIFIRWFSVKRLEEFDINSSELLMYGTKRQKWRGRACRLLSASAGVQDLQRPPGGEGRAGGPGPHKGDIDYWPPHLWVGHHLSRLCLPLVPHDVVELQYHRRRQLLDRLGRQVEPRGQAAVRALVVQYPERYVYPWGRLYVSANFQRLVLSAVSKPTFASK